MSVVHDTIRTRAKTHGDYRTQSRIAEAITEALSYGPQRGGLTAYQRQSLRMIGVKMARIVCGDPTEVDHWRDIAGYATLAADILEGENHHGE